MAQAHEQDPHDPTEKEGKVIEVDFMPQEVKEILQLDDADFVDYLLMRLQHTTVPANEIAKTLKHEAGANYDQIENPFQARWTALVNKSPMFGDSYDEYIKDPTIRSLSHYMRLTQTQESMSREREAARILMDLSAILVDNGHPTDNVARVHARMATMPQSE